MLRSAKSLSASSVSHARSAARMRAEYLVTRAFLVDGFGVGRAWGCVFGCGRVLLMS